MAALLQTTLAVRAMERQQLHGHRPAAVARLRPAERLPSTNHLRLAIGLPLRNPEALTNLLRQLSDPGSPQYRRYLTPEQFTERFGPTEQDYQAVIRFAQASGLSVTQMHPNRLLLGVDGSVADIERTFHLTLRVYPHPRETRTFFAPDADPSLDLAVPVLHIAGLDNFTKPHPMSLREATPEQGAAGLPRLGSGPNGSYMGNDFRAAYVPDSDLDGAGQAVGLFELDGYYASDVKAYKSQAKLANVPIQSVLVDGFSGTPQGIGPGSGNEEVALDIEVAISMAPGLSRVLVYEGSPDGGSATIDHILNRMATDNLARQLSCSWGFDIDAISQQIFLQYVAQGQSFYLASGDKGAFGGAALQPSDNPNITVVGGTTLTTSNEGAWASESAWEGSGGGISTIYPLPDWQQGIDMSKNQGSTSMRNMPDVAMVAQNVWLMADRGRAFSVNGTSIAAPLWAAFTALANQQAAAQGLPAVGFINPAVYALGRGTNYTTLFHDVTTGNNTNTDSRDLYFATAGYDLCTGWGSPAGTNLINALVGPPSGTLLITSPLGFIASGPSGGPFNVASQIFTLTNLGTAPLNWSMINTSAWLTVAPPSGTLLPGGPAAAVTVALNGAASNLLLGSYTANVAFLNLANGTAQRREFSLLVGNAGFENGDFSNWTFDGQTDVNFANSVDLGEFRNGSMIPGVDDTLFVHSGIYGAFLGQNTTLGSLAQTLPTMPGQLYRISFWLDNPTNGVPNEFLVTWDGTNLFDQVDLDQLAWTNLQFVATASTSSTVLSFGFRNDLNAFGLDDVSVQLVGTPSRALTLSGNFSFGEVPVGQTTQLVLTISNAGNAALTVTGINYPEGFTGTWSGTISPGSTQTIPVVFAPTAVGSYGGVVTVQSDSTDGSNTLPISGTGIPVTTAATVVINPEDLRKVYNGLPRPVTAITTPANLALNITYNGSNSPPADTGSYAVLASVSQPGYVGSTSATLAIVPAVLTVTADNANRTYGAVNPPFRATITGFVNGESAAALSGAPAFVTSAMPSSPVGTYPIIPEQGTLMAKNYAFSNFINGTLLVTPAVLAVTAKDASRAYGTGNPPFSATITGFVNGETESVLSGAPAFNAKTTPASPAGTYPIIPSQGTLTATNYIFGGFTNGTLLVTPAVLTVRANDASRAFGASNPTFSATISGFVNGETAAVLSGAAALTTSATATSPAGAYPIIPSLGTLRATNYAFGSFINGTLKILPIDTTLNSPALVTGTFTVSITTAIGLNYTLEYRNSLADSAWQSGQRTKGTGGTVTLSDQASDTTARYYRVRID